MENRTTGRQLPGEIIAEPTDRDGEGAVLQFRSQTDKAIYVHNLKMRERNRWWVYGSMISGPLLGLVAFYLLRRRIVSGSDNSHAIELATRGFLSSFIVPHVISFATPLQPAGFRAASRTIRASASPTARTCIKAISRRRWTCSPTCRNPPSQCKPRLAPMAHRRKRLIHTWRVSWRILVAEAAKHGQRVA